MSANTVQIADLLLGIAPPTGGMPFGIDEGKNASAFGDIMSGMILSTQQQDINTDNLLFGDGSIQEKAVDNAGTILDELLQTISGATSGANNISGQEQTSVVAAVQENVVHNRPHTQQKDPDNTVQGQIQPQVSMSTLPASEYVRDIIDGNQVELQAGRYEVHDIKLQGDSVRFDLSPLDKAGTAIRISLPVNKLLDGDMPGITNPQQIAVTGRERAILEDYLAKLDVKELVITLRNNASNQTAVASNDEVGVEIVALNAGQVVSLKSRMTRQEINTRMLAMTAKGIEPIKAEGLQIPASNVKPVVQLETTAQNELDWFNRQHLWNSDDTFPRQTGGQTDSKQPGNIGLALTIHNQVSAPTGRVLPQTVRFTLPDNLATTLRPNGHSVQLRIEPEHLGPARLSLTLRHNRLRAVVTVETHQAQAVLEKSLDKLHNTLTQAGVQVEYIDVNVDPRQSGEQLFRHHGQPDYKRIQLSPLSMNESDTNVTQHSLSVRMYSAESYIRANGLNILA